MMIIPAKEMDEKVKLRLKKGLRINDGADDGTY